MEEPQPLAMASAPGRFVAYVQVFLDNPLYSLATAVFALILVVVVSDYLDYVNQRRRLGGDIPIVGDAPYIWRRLRWTEAQSNLRNVLQRGYDNVRWKSAESRENFADRTLVYKKIQTVGLSRSA